MIFIKPVVPIIDKKHVIEDIFQFAMIGDLLFLAFVLYFLDEACLVQDVFSAFEGVRILIAPRLLDIDHFQLFEDTFAWADLNFPLSGLDIVFRL